MKNFQHDPDPTVKGSRIQSFVPYQGIKLSIYVVAEVDVEGVRVGVEDVVVVIRILP